MLFVGGISLLLQLLLSENKAKTWMKTSKLLQHLTLACGLVYTVAIALGLITLLPGITIDPVTAVLLIIYGISIFYLAGCIQKVSQLYPPEKFPELNTTDSKRFPIIKGSIHFSIPGCADNARSSFSTPGGSSFPYKSGCYSIFC
jgi:hypothetical protein